MKDANYFVTVICQGVEVPIVAPIINDRMRGVLERGSYEKNEVALLRKLLRKNDRVVELGAGVSVVSTAAAQILGPERVSTIEANPELIPVITETHRINDVSGILLFHGVAMPNPEGKSTPFFLRENFWASSLGTRASDDPARTRIVEVPVLDLNKIIHDIKPNVLVIDIEGGELEVVRGLELSSFRAVLVELHPRAYG